MFKNKIDFDALSNFNKNTLSTHIGIEFIEKGDDYLIARMPVDDRTRQPYGILHGGASVVLAETLGSIASAMCLDDPLTQKAVGLEINANHLKSVTEGWVYGTVTPIHVGRRTHVWDIKIRNEEGQLTCVSRLTVAII